MKLRKQTPAKAFIVALTAGLLAALYAVIRADPRIEAGSETQQLPVDYQRFFAPDSSRTTQTLEDIEPRGRTRAS